MHSALAGRVAAVVVGLLAFGCGGTTGPQGPAGPPADRSKLYCRRNPATLNAATSDLSVSATCDKKTDIPWEGSCEASGLPTGLYLTVNEPVGWEDLNAVPGWTCAWAAYGVAPDLDFGGAAEICCFAVGHTP